MLPPHTLDPLGPDPAWRHLRAVHFVAAGLPADHPRDDELSRQAWRFYLALHDCEDDWQHEVLARHSPALFAAHRFFTTATPLQRAELEARILAGQEDAAVAAKCGLPPDAVAAYHDFYFDVRAKLDATVYVLNVAIGEKVHRGLTEDDRDLILKLVGYTKGPFVLQSLLDYYADPLQLPGDLDRLSRLTPDEVKVLLGKLSIKACLVALTAPGDERYLRLGPVLLDLADQLRAAAEKPWEASSALQAPLEAFARCVQALGRPEAAPAPPQLAEDSSAAEAEIANRIEGEPSLTHGIPREAAADVRPPRKRRATGTASSGRCVRRRSAAGAGVAGAGQKVGVLIAG